jgi:chromosome segregation ATPase
MPPTGKRPSRSGRPFTRDPRIDSTPPPGDIGSVHPVSRVSALESELARVRDEREAEADDLAAMLVRIAEAERAKATSARAAAELDERVHMLAAQLEEMEAARATWAAAQGTEATSELAILRQQLVEAEERLTESQAMSNELRARCGEADQNLQAVQRQLGHTQEAVRLAGSRVGLAERSAADGAEALQRAHTEMEADRARVVDLETKLARVKREHAALAEAGHRTLSDAIDAAEGLRLTEVAALEAKHAEALQEAERRHAEAMAALRQDQDAALSELRSEHRMALDEGGQRHAAEMAALSKRWEGDVAVWQKKYEEALPALEQRHAHTLSALREEQGAAKRAAARAIEEERSAAARAKQQVSTLEGSLTSMRAMVARATQVLDELERREEMAAALRTRAIVQAKQVLAGGPGEPPEDGAPVAVATSHAHPTVEPGSLDAIDIDLTE